MSRAPSSEIENWMCRDVIRGLGSVISLNLSQYLALPALREHRMADLATQSIFKDFFLEKPWCKAFVLISENLQTTYDGVHLAHPTSANFEQKQFLPQHFSDLLLNNRNVIVRNYFCAFINLNIKFKLHRIVICTKQKAESSICSLLHRLLIVGMNVCNIEINFLFWPILFGPISFDSH